MDESKFRTELKNVYKFHRVDFSTFGGELEAAILVEGQHSARSKPKLLQRFQLSERDYI